MPSVSHLGIDRQEEARGGVIAICHQLIGTIFDWNRKRNKIRERSKKKNRKKKKNRNRNQRRGQEGSLPSASN